MLQHVVKPCQGSLEVHGWRRQVALGLPALGAVLFLVGWLLGKRLSLVEGVAGTPLFSACTGKSSVDRLPSVCWPLLRMSARDTRWLLDEFLRREVMALASVAGVKYCRALLNPCFLARSSWRARLALGAVRAIPPGVCSVSPVHMIRGCCWSRPITAISRSVPYC